jgi:chemotaxis response regulator CheB
LLSADRPGATAPLRDILTNLPANLPAAVFVVLHIPVLQAQRGMAIKNGHIYIAVPDHHRHLPNSGWKSRLPLVSASEVIV